MDQMAKGFSKVSILNFGKIAENEPEEDDLLPPPDDSDGSWVEIEPGLWQKQPIKPSEETTVNDDSSEWLVGTSADPSAKPKVDKCRGKKKKKSKQYRT